jgi:DNA polymerase III subunit epsilon
MNVLIFDTETTGLPTRRGASPSEHEAWPHVVQIAWQVCDEEGTTIERGSHIVLPDGWEIPEESTRVHHITTAQARRHGVPLRAALHRFALALATTDLLVAHNIDFDLPLLQAEFHRLFGKSGVDVLVRTPGFCTMKTSTELCRIPSRNGYGYEWPSLEEPHRFLFDVGVEGAHDAGANVDACARCFFELVRRGQIAVPTPQLGIVKNRHAPAAQLVA